MTKQGPLDPASRFVVGDPSGRVANVYDVLDVGMRRGVAGTGSVYWWESQPLRNLKDNHHLVPISAGLNREVQLRKEGGKIHWLSPQKAVSRRSASQTTFI